MGPDESSLSQWSGREPGPGLCISHDSDLHSMAFLQTMEFSGWNVIVDL